MPRLERVDQVQDPRSGVGVELAGRLIAQQHVRLLGKRTRDRDALRLAAGQLRRQRIELGREPDELEQIGRIESLGPRSAPCSARDVLREGDVLERRERRQQVGSLEHVCHRPRPGLPAGRRVKR